MMDFALPFYTIIALMAFVFIIMIVTVVVVIVLLVKAIRYSNPSNDMDVLKSKQFDPYNMEDVNMKCPKCNCIVKKDFIYCPKCGTELKKNEIENIIKISNHS